MARKPVLLYREVEMPHPEFRKGTRMLDPVELKSEIRRRAYRLYELRGKAHGFALDDWLQAQAEFLEEFLQQHCDQMAAGQPPRARKTG